MSNPSTERRGAPRFELTLPVEIRTIDGLQIAAELVNISSSGFKIRFPILIRVGTKITVRIDGRVSRRARVAWQVGEELGCSFLQPLDLGRVIVTA